MKHRTWSAGDGAADWIVGQPTCIFFNQESGWLNRFFRVFLSSVRDGVVYVHFHFMDGLRYLEPKSRPVCFTRKFNSSESSSTVFSLSFSLSLLTIHPFKLELIAVIDVRGGGRVRKFSKYLLRSIPIWESAQHTVGHSLTLQIHRNLDKKIQWKFSNLFLTGYTSSDGNRSVKMVNLWNFSSSATGSFWFKINVINSTSPSYKRIGIM